MQCSNNILLYVTLFVISKAQNVYQCDPDVVCIVNCSNPMLNSISVNFSCNSGTIIGENASELSVLCLNKNSCDNIIVNCPTNLNFVYNNISHPQCQLKCYDEGSCNNIMLKTYAALVTAVWCGNVNGTDNAIHPICTNILINGTYDSIQSIPDKQDIIITCTLQQNAEKASCINMTFDHIGYLNTDIELYCLNPSSGDNQSVETCNSIKFNGCNISRFLMDATGGIKTAEIDISSITLNQVDIIIDSPDGFMEDIIIYANNSKSLLLKLEPDTMLTNSLIFGGENITIDSLGIIDELQLEAQLDGYLNISIGDNSRMSNCEIAANDAISGIIVSSSNAIIQNVAYSLVGAETVDVMIYGKAEEVKIYAENTNNLTVLCDSYDTEIGCDGLEIRGPSYTKNDEEIRKRTRIYCYGYGCKYLVLWFMNGLLDIDLIASECPCWNDTDFCIDRWLLYCNYNENIEEFSTSIFTNNCGCEDDDDEFKCCDGINNHSFEMLQCDQECDSEDVHFWTTGAILGFSIGAGILLLVIFVFILMCYRRKQEAQSNYGRLVESGYGATT